jgi:hypothetical protein
MIAYSNEESKYFGLRIGRANLSKSSLIELNSEIELGKFDVVRLRVENSDDESLNVIQSLKHKVESCGSIIRYQQPVQELSTQELSSEVSVRVYRETDYDALSQIIELGSAKNPIGYWSTPGLEKLVSRDDEIAYLINYYSKLFVTEQRQIWIMFWNDNPVGFTANEIENGILDTPLAVVLPDYRGKKLLQEFMIHRNNFAIKNELKVIANGARVNNNASQHVYAKFGMQAVGQDAVYHILPMLSRLG